ncbi:hypothetical protein Poly30_54510 [Planctomycetes bacterium Poly30]|uniref:Right handed beta helix domain-containing protein n=1 Tax=Saltatorellus ferox TaxID=2528018 RepID=A0A518F0M4_9BACT|nr:hypothetical protein Poly30_54510 [Planctomycetes bacterium Poly30]
MNGFLPIAATLALAPAALADVHVVDASGAGEFLDIADAVVSAIDGDTVLVRAGLYAAPVTLDGTAITIVGTPGATVEIAEQLVVRGSSADQTVVLSGLTFLDGFLLENCQGPIRMQDCAALRSIPNPPSWGFTSPHECGIGLSRQEVRSCDHVAFTACELQGDHGILGGSDGTPGEHALLVDQSRVLVFDTDLWGGDGGDGLWGLHGGAYGGAGGDGLHITAGASEIICDDLRATGGLGATTDLMFLVFPGCDGLPVRGRGLSALDRPDVGLEAPALIAGDDLATFRIIGPAGRLAVLQSNPSAAYRPLGVVAGPLLIGSPVRFTVHGPIPATGQLDVPVTGIDPFTAEDAVSLHFQALVFDVPRRLLTEPRHVTFVHRSL